MAVERGLIVVKPDAVHCRFAGGILGRIEATGFEIREAKLAAGRRDFGEEHCAEHRESPLFRELVEFITSGPTWALVVNGEAAIATVRATIGATDPANIVPGTVRPRPLDTRQARARGRRVGAGGARERALVR